MSSVRMVTIRLDRGRVLARPMLYWDPDGVGWRCRSGQSGRRPGRTEREIGGFGFARHGGCSSDVSTAAAGIIPFPVIILFFSQYQEETRAAVMRVARAM